MSVLASYSIWSSSSSSISSRWDTMGMLFWYVSIFHNNNKNLTFFVLLLLIFLFLLLQYPLKNDKWYKIETHNIVIYLYRWEAPNFNVLNYGLTTLFLYGRRIDYSTSCCFQVFRLWFCWRLLSRVSSSELYFVVYLLVLVYCIVLFVCPDAFLFFLHEEIRYRRSLICCGIYYCLSYCSHTFTVSFVVLFYTIWFL